MVKGSIVLETWRNEAVARVNKHLTERFKAQSVIDSDEGMKESKGFAAWDFNLHVNEKDLRVRLVVDKRFPFSLPKLFLLEKNRDRILPHVSSTGLVCVVPSSASSSHRQPEKLVDFVISQAVECLKDSMSGAHLEDLIDEFEAYWIESVDLQGLKAICLINPQPPSRQIYCYVTRGHVVFADSVNELESWLANAKWNAPNHKWEYQKTLFAWLPKPVPANEFPLTNQEVKEFLTTQPDAVEILSFVIPQKTMTLPILFGMMTKNGAALAAMVLPEPKETGKPGTGRMRSFKRDGFRDKSSIPPGVLQSRFLAGVPVKRLITRRADRVWHSFRGGTQSCEGLADKTICIIGCGALGSHVALNLAKCGVKKLTLIDGEILQWENIGRHVLGAEYVGQFKEVALGSFLGKQLPHLELEWYASLQWQDVLESSPIAITGADVIVSTTGSWACDDSLNLIARTKGSAVPPVVLGWAEPFACAGHALVIGKKGGCLRCSMDENGNFSEAATVWEKDTLATAGPCGQLFQPFGVAELLPIQACVVRSTIECLQGLHPTSHIRSWLGDAIYLNNCGGQWSDSALNQLKENSKAGGIFVDQEWPSSDSCVFCNSNEET